MSSLLAGLEFNPLKRFYKFILKNIIGSFLKDELDPEQLDVQLANGVIELRDLELNIQALNELMDGLPVTLSSAFVHSIKIEIPLMQLLKDPQHSNCKITIEELEFVLEPVLESSGHVPHHDTNPLSHSHLFDVPLDQFSKDDLSASIQLHKRYASELRKSQGNFDDLHDGDDAEHDNDDDDDDAYKSNESMGLEVVASFVEQIVSRIEVEMTDVSLKFKHQQNNKAVDEAAQMQTCVIVKFPWLSYSDRHDPSSAAMDAKSADSPSDTHAERNHASSSGGGGGGLKYEYDKVVKFNGFRVELLEQSLVEDFDQVLELDKSFNSLTNLTARNITRTIIHGNKDQDCIITMKIRVRTGQVDMQCFVQSLRMLVGPRQIALLLDFFEALMESSSDVAAKAKAVEKAMKEHKANANAELKKFHTPEIKPMSHAPPLLPLDLDPPTSKPLTAADFSVIEDLLRTAAPTSMDLPHVAARPVVKKKEEDMVHFYEMDGNDDNKQNDDDSIHARRSSATAIPVEKLIVERELWTFKLQVRDTSISLLENEGEEWPFDWYLTPVPKNQPKTRLSSQATTSHHGGHTNDHDHIHDTAPIVGVRGDHLWAHLDNLQFFMKQGVENVNMQLTVDDFELVEYLLLETVRVYADGQREVIPIIPNMYVEDNAASDYRFRSHSLINFDEQVPDKKNSIEEDDEEDEEEATVERKAFENIASLALNPRFSLLMNQSTNNFLPPHPDEHPEHVTPIKQRLVLEFEPCNVFVDLGFAERSATLYNSLLDAKQYVNAHLSGVVIESAPPTERQILIKSNAMTVNVFFPNHGAMPVQLNEDEKFTDMTIDRRGMLHPEHLAVQVQSTVISNLFWPAWKNEEETSAEGVRSKFRSDPLKMSEWLVSFSRARATVSYPHPTLQCIHEKQVLLVAGCLGNDNSHNLEWIIPFVQITSRLEGPQVFQSLEGKSEYSPQMHVDLRKLFEHFRTLPSFRVWEQQLNSQKPKPSDVRISPNEFEETSWCSGALTFLLCLPSCEVNITKDEYKLLLQFQTRILEYNPALNAIQRTGEKKHDTAAGVDDFLGRSTGADSMSSYTSSDRSDGDYRDGLDSRLWQSQSHTKPLQASILDEDGKQSPVEEDEGKQSSSPLIVQDISSSDDEGKASPVSSPHVVEDMPSSDTDYENSDSDVMGNTQFYSIPDMSESTFLRNPVDGSIYATAQESDQMDTKSVAQRDEDSSEQKSAFDLDGILEGSVITTRAPLVGDLSDSSGHESSLFNSQSTQGMSTQSLNSEMGVNPLDASAIFAHASVAAEQHQTQKKQEKKSVSFDSDQSTVVEAVESLLPPNMHGSAVKVIIHECICVLSENITSRAATMALLTNELDRLRTQLAICLEQVADCAGSTVDGRLETAVNVLREVVQQKETDLAHMQALSVHDDTKDDSVDCDRQSFFVHLQEASIFVVSGYLGKSLSYITSAFGNITLKSLEHVVHETCTLAEAATKPLLFKRELAPKRDLDQKSNMTLNRDMFRLVAPKYDSWVDPIVYVQVLLDGPYETEDGHRRMIDCAAHARALTLQFQVEDDFTIRLSNFFTLEAGAVQTVEAPFVDVTKVVFNAYDCSIDYNPVDLAARGILNFDHVQLTTTIQSDLDTLDMQLEMWGGSLFLLDKSDKVTFTQLPSLPWTYGQLAELPSVCLSQVQGDVYDHFVILGFAKVLNSTFLKVKVLFPPATSGEGSLVEITGTPANMRGATGEEDGITLLTCFDSWDRLYALVTHFINSISAVVEIPDVEVDIPASDDHSVPLSVLKQKQAELASLGGDAKIGLAEEVKEETKAVAQPAKAKKSVRFNLLDAVQQDMFDNDTKSIVSQPSASSAKKKKPINVVENYSSGKSVAHPRSQSTIPRRPRSNSGGGKRGRRVAPMCVCCPSDPSQSRARWFTAEEIMLPSNNVGDGDILRASFLKPGVSVQPPPTVVTFANAAGPLTNIQTNYIVRPDLDDQKRVIRKEDMAAPVDYPKPLGRFVIWDVNLHWRIFDGADFAVEMPKKPVTPSKPKTASSHTRREDVDDNDDDSDAPYAEDPMLMSQHVYAQHSGMAGDGHNKVEQKGNAGLDAFLSQPPSPEKRPPKSVEKKKKKTKTPERKDKSERRAVVGRKTDRVLEIAFIGLHVARERYGTHEQVASRLKFAIENVYIKDLLVTSPFKYTLRYHAGTRRSRELHRCMLDLTIASVRPNPFHFPEREEARVTLRLLPIRVFLDQDVMDFFGDFFSAYPAYAALANQTEAAAEIGEEEGKEAPAVTYIQCFDMNAVQFCIDYKPHRVNFGKLQDGDYSQLIHLFPLEKMPLILPASRVYGSQGYGALFDKLLPIWAERLSQAQVQPYLESVQPIHSFVKVGHGMVNLIVIPYNQYKKDNRLLLGLEKGASHFFKTVAVEAINVTNKLAEGAQTLLEATDDIFTVSRPGEHRDEKRMRHRAMSAPTGPNPRSMYHHRTSDPPAGVGEGMQQAYLALSAGLQTALHGMVIVPGEDYKRYGAKTAIKSAVSAIPRALLHPMIGATEGLSRALLGARSSMSKDDDPEKHQTYKS